MPVCHLPEATYDCTQWAATLKHVLAVRGLREAEAEPPGSEEPPSFTEAALYPDLGEEYERGW